MNTAEMSTPLTQNCSKRRTTESSTGFGPSLRTEGLGFLTKKVRTSSSTYPTYPSLPGCSREFPLSPYKFGSEIVFGRTWERVYMYSSSGAIEGDTRPNTATAEMGFFLNKGIVSKLVTP